MHAKLAICAQGETPRQVNGTVRIVSFHDVRGVKLHTYAVNKVKFVKCKFRQIH